MGFSAGGVVRVNVVRKPKFGLYSEAQCNSTRSELASIAGKRVAIVARYQDDAGNWGYVVYDSMNKTSPTFACSENELFPVAPIPFVTDSERMSGVIVQTVELRYSARCDGLRRLLRERGHDPLKCIQIGCDQGRGVLVTLVLPDGTVVSADYQQDRQTRQASHFLEWNIDNYPDRVIELCREVLSKDDTSEFDTMVRCYFDEHE
jgi:hypothetical protein